MADDGALTEAIHMASATARFLIGAECPHGIFGPTVACHQRRHAAVVRQLGRPGNGDHYGMLKSGSVTEPSSANGNPGLCATSQALPSGSVKNAA